MIRRVNQQFRAMTRGQGMLEFALALPVLLLLLFGIIEFGRMILTYASVYNAAREAVRYGAAVSTNTSGTARYRDCQGMRDTARSTSFFAGLEDSDIDIRYDAGPEDITPWNSKRVCPDDANLGDRVVVRVSTTYTPIVPLVLRNGFPVSSEAARTVIRDVDIIGPPPPSPTPRNTRTSTVTPQYTPTDTGTVTQTSTQTLTPTISTTPTETIVPSETPTHTHTPTGTRTETLTPTATNTWTPTPSPTCIGGVCGPTATATATGTATNTATPTPAATMNTCSSLTRAYSSDSTSLTISITNTNVNPVYLSEIQTITWQDHDASSHPLLTTIRLRGIEIYHSAGDTSPKTVTSSEWLSSSNLQIPGLGHSQPSTIVIVVDDKAKNWSSWRITFSNSNCTCTSSGCN